MASPFFRETFAAVPETKENDNDYETTMIMIPTTITTISLPRTQFSIPIFFMSEEDVRIGPNPMKPGYKDPNSVWKVTALKLPRRKEAKDILKTIGKVVKPIMHRHDWHVEVLQEFYPDDPSIQGVNVGNGLQIKLRVRRADSDLDFLPVDQILDNMLHELCHNDFGPHDADFYNLLGQLRMEWKDLLAKGSGAWSHLGKGTHKPSKPRYLGGNRRIMKALSPIEAARMAAERRMPMIDHCCGSSALGDTKDEGSSDKSHDCGDTEQRGASEYDSDSTSQVSDSTFPKTSHEKRSWDKFQKLAHTISDYDSDSSDSTSSSSDSSIQVSGSTTRKTGHEKRSSKKSQDLAHTEQRGTSKRDSDSSIQVMNSTSQKTGRKKSKSNKPHKPALTEHTGTSKHDSDSSVHVSDSTLLKTSHETKRSVSESTSPKTSLEKGSWDNSYEILHTISEYDSDSSDLTSSSSDSSIQVSDSASRKTGLEKRSLNKSHDVGRFKELRGTTKRDSDSGIQMLNSTSQKTGHTKSKSSKSHKPAHSEQIGTSEHDSDPSAHVPDSTSLKTGHEKQRSASDSTSSKTGHEKRSVSSSTSSKTGHLTTETPSSGRMAMAEAPPSCYKLQDYLLPVKVLVGVVLFELIRGSFKYLFS